MESGAGDLHSLRHKREVHTGDMAAGSLIYDHSVGLTKPGWADRRRRWGSRRHIQVALR